MPEVLQGLVMGAVCIALGVIGARSLLLERTRYLEAQLERLHLTLEGRVKAGILASQARWEHELAMQGVTPPKKATSNDDDLQPWAMTDDDIAEMYPGARTIPMPAGANGKSADDEFDNE